ncbi:hypothetical protein [Natrinema salifodinae]|uniref:hypothetical protein n=1 Tax=Natrinema salifodinae TaxID=1202768 RepID=UPI000B2856B3|nr:hypothetical protein [Natrinema salifodinae]
MSEQPSASDDREDSSLPVCPRCGSRAVLVTTRGPMEHVVSPCGCRIGSPGL